MDERKGDGNYDEGGVWRLILILILGGDGWYVRSLRY